MSRHTESESWRMRGDLGFTRSTPEVPEATASVTDCYGCFPGALTFEKTFLSFDMLTAKMYHALAWLTSG